METRMRRCSKCKVVKSADEFPNTRSQCRSCRNAQQRDRYKNDPEYRANSIKKAQEWTYKEYHTNPEFRRKWIAYMYARIRNAEKDGTVTERSLGILLDTWTGVCPRCNKEAAPTIDHIVPITKGGKHSIDNLQLMCGPCNASKGNR